MRCYYELLGVPQNVEPIDLKKAYYKLSLQWHPDKNTKEDTTIIFQEIQEAYKVLSDPHERAWYDKHRAQILQGDSRVTQMGGGGTSDYQEDRVDVFQYFTRSCFEKFDDSPKGFYTVYGKVFADITKEERHAAAFSGNPISSSESDSDNDGDDEDGSSGSKSRSYPPFGTSSSSYTEVVAPFYLFWETFETKKTYTWVEKYDTRCADSRQERRAMEAENSRLRMAAIRKRNEEIHQLVAYVKKRDKRVLAEKERVQRAAEEAKARNQSMAVKARQREAAQLAEAWNDEIAFGGIASQWSEQFEAELARMEAELDGTVQKNSKSKQQCDDDDELEDVDDENVGDSMVDTVGNDNDDDNDDKESNNEIDELYCIACDKLFASIKAKQNHESSKKHRKQLELLRKVISEEDSVLQEHLNSVIQLENCHLNDNDNDGTGDLSNTSTSQQPTVKLTKRAKKAERKRKKEAEAQNSTVININEETVVEVVDDTQSVDNVDNSELDIVTKEPTLNNSPDQPDDNTPLPSTSTTTTTTTNQSKKESKKMKSTSSKVNKIICDICSVEFDSRNSLFNHLRESGHARLKSTVVNTVQNSDDDSMKTKCKGKSKHKR